MKKTGTIKKILNGLKNRVTDAWHNLNDIPMPDLPPPGGDPQPASLQDALNNEKHTKTVAHNSTSHIFLGTQSSPTETTSSPCQDLKELLDYLWDDEKRHWEEDGRPEKHIFNTLCRLKNYINSPEAGPVHNQPATRGLRQIPPRHSTASQTGRGTQP
jgi:hypothetical protein